MQSQRQKAVTLRVAFFVLGAFALSLAAATSAPAVCPNEAVRNGPSSSLPDCRAYELVTPPNSNGRRFFDVSAISEVYDLFETELASPLRDSLVYSTLAGPLQESDGATGIYDIYEAQRTPSGWGVQRRLSPSGEQAVFPEAGGVSADHRYAFTHVREIQNGAIDSGSLAAAGDGDYLSRPDGTFQLTGIGQLGVERLAQGRYISPGGDHVIFTTGGIWCQRKASKCKKLQLEPDAPPTGTAAIYDRSPDGPTKVVSLLPSNEPLAAGEDAEYQGSSTDGSSIAFKVGGTLYVRLDNSQTKEATKDPADYAGLSASGDALFYVSSGNIFRFDTESGQREQINFSNDGQVVNISADGSHVYFISQKQLEGSKGTDGQPNLYVWSGATPEYVATVLPSDLLHTSGAKVGVPALGNWTTWVVNPDRDIDIGRGPGANASRTTPDGRVLAFESRAELTSYSNGAHTEIYRYDDESKSIQCVSCNPLAEPATSDAHFQELNTARPPTLIHNLSADGTRLFFETSEPLVSRDVDQITDVYEWHEFAAGSGHSIDLISSGVSIEYPPAEPPAPKPNVLLGIPPSGSDVFFLSQDRLLPEAGGGGASAIYDARVNGGFPQSVPGSSCGDMNTCRTGTGEVPHALLVPQSTRGSKGNVKPRKRCRRAHSRKAKQRKHTKCHRTRHKRGPSR